MIRVLVFVALMHFVHLRIINQNVRASRDTTEIHMQAVISDQVSLIFILKYMGNF